MPQLVDTTIRLLSQEPLAERVSAAGLYELAGELDKAGFSSLGGVGRRLLRIAPCGAGWRAPGSASARSARCSTPLGMALRGRFLVGGRPVS